MASKPRNILIFGATGTIGTFITDAIVTATPSFAKVGIFTSPATVKSKAPQIEALRSRGVEIVVGSLHDEADLVSTYKNYDTVVSCVGREVLPLQVDLARLAEASGTVKWFFPSEYGTDVEYSPKSAQEKPHQQKLKIRSYLRSHAKTLGYTFIVTGPYSDLFLERSPIFYEAGGFDCTEKKAIVTGTGNEKISMTTMADTGKLVVKALQHPDASKNKALRVNSFTTTGHDIVKKFEKQTGGGKWDVQYLSLEQLKENEIKMWEGGVPLAPLVTLRRIWAEGGTLYEKRDNELIGEPEMETLESQVKKLVAAAK